jgi:hypothetical protein
MTGFPIRMTDPEIALFSAQLRTSNFYLEFGCGGSTILAAQSESRFIVSAESDANWIAKLKQHETIKTALGAGTLFLEHIDLGPVRDWGAPADEQKIKVWPEYYMRPFKKYDYAFDLILIDGRFRINCALTAVVFSVETARVLIHDYELRARYFNIEKFYEITDSVGTLYLMRRKTHINHRSLYIDVINNLFNHA